MCGRYYITEETKIELEKIVHDLDHKINGVKFTGDIVPSAKAPNFTVYIRTFVCYNLQNKQLFFF